MSEKELQMSGEAQKGFGLAPVYNAQAMNVLIANGSNVTRQTLETIRLYTLSKKKLFVIFLP